MNGIPVIAIFDIGKTNKKLFLFNEQYQIVWEQTVRFEETVDEDGFVCEDLPLLIKWVQESITEIFSLPEFTIKAINFSAYGASFVHIGSAGKPVAPLYNYLKPFPPALKEKFYQVYGDEMAWSVATASPVLGNLNSGMQLYYLKNEKKNIYDQIDRSLHLPQYISYLLTGKTFSDITSIGCHTGLWDFEKNEYHEWVRAENIQAKLSPIYPSNGVVDVVWNNKKLKIGIGLHDSSSALIPYLSSFSEPFVLLSTGTWCISLNPFNHDPLQVEELKQDCLCYIEYKGHPIKASRLFAGNEHEQQVKILANHFHVSTDQYKQVLFDAALLSSVNANQENQETGLYGVAFTKKVLENFNSYEEAYHLLVYNIIQEQKKATSLILNNHSVKRIFVDGGFAKNPVYMHLLAAAFPYMEVFAASVSQATAIGAALAIHSSWNTKSVPGDMVELKYYSITK